MKIPFARIFRNSSVVSYVLCALIVGSFYFTSSCTLEPACSVRLQPSFDGTAQDSGFKGFTEEGFGILSENAVARYNAFVGLYGQYFQPPLTNFAGCHFSKTNAMWLIEPQYLVRFQTMSRWFRSGKTPL